MTKIVLLILILICSEAAADVAGGIAAYQRGDYAAAFSEFSVAAAKDDPFSQNVLGTLYAQGQGVERNYKLAMDWFYKAQTLGSPEAMSNLAKMYESGMGVPQNNSLALKYYRDAALTGFEPAILHMASIYEKGKLGVTPDTRLALEWKDRIRGNSAGVSKVFAMAAKPPAALVHADIKQTAGMTLPKPPRQANTVISRLDKGAQFEQQLMQRLANDRQGERKLFVAASDDKPSLAGYLKELRAQLKSLLKLAFSNLKPDERMIVTLSILRDGTLRNIELNQGTRNPNTDRKILSTLKKLARIQPMSAETEPGVDVLVLTVRLPIE